MMSNKSKTEKTPKLLAQTPSEIAQLFFNSADHERARELSIELTSVMGLKKNSHATNAVALSMILVSFVRVLPDRGVDGETLDGILTLAHALLSVNQRKDIPPIN